MRLYRRRFRRRLRLGLLGLVLGLVLLMHFRWLPAVRRLSAMQVENETSNLINDAVLACITAQDLRYSELISMEKADGGRLAALQLDVIRVNRLRSEILLELGRLIPDMDTHDLGVPLGSVFFPALLSGRGGRLPIRVIALRGANAELQSSFTQAGINQTLHTLELHVGVELLLLTPAGLQTAEVTTDVPVAQTVIVGEVPDTLLTIGE